ncbi:hypothetical protein NKH17_31815 [Mesorhizobium sp. M1334]|uniref:hypothetical protein n=1 Tax=Mesorhizobium sp. M1334 TaxID=2957084 RepID=UPI00333748CA
MSIHSVVVDGPLALRMERLDAAREGDLVSRNKTVSRRWRLRRHRQGFRLARNAIGRALRSPELVGRRYGVQKDSKFTYDLGKDCMNFLGARYGPTRPLLVDEYQNFTPTVLRELLHLQEHCGFALLLAGNTHRLAGTRRDTHAMDQIESRIGMRFEIGQPTREDCVRIGAEHNVEGADALRVGFHKSSKHALAIQAKLPHLRIR